jgi:hypothetical protein
MGRSSQIALLDVEPMEDTMENGREKDGGRRDENQSRQQRIS